MAQARLEGFRVNLEPHELRAEEFIKEINSTHLSGVSIKAENNSRENDKRNYSISIDPLASPRLRSISLERSQCYAEKAKTTIEVFVEINAKRKELFAQADEVLAKMAKKHKGILVCSDGYDSTIDPETLDFNVRRWFDFGKLGGE
jgi:hypothetical protein